MNKKCAAAAATPATIMKLWVAYGTMGQGEGSGNPNVFIYFFALLDPSLAQLNPNLFVLKSQTIICLKHSSTQLICFYPHWLYSLI
jgi:hypothetical protein